VGGVAWWWCAGRDPSLRLCLASSLPQASAPFSLVNNFTVLGLLHYFSAALHADTGTDPIEAAAPKTSSSAILISPPARLECSVSHLPHYSPRRNLPHERSCRAAYMRTTTVFTDLQSSAYPIATCRPSLSVAQRMDKPRSAWTPCPESQSPTHHADPCRMGH
jgi:hypothetical protein